jgi:succinyl-diaminopimelate desuccinylase
LAEQRPDPVALAQRLLATPSMTPPGDTAAAAALLVPLLQQAGFAITLHDTPRGGRNLLAVLPGAGTIAPLCLTGHLDTVPLGDAHWSVDPFGGAIRDGRLYGRGASDMKAGVAALVAAAVETARFPARAADVVLILTAEEESGSQGAMALADAHLLPRRASALLVAEPTACRPLLGHKGALWVRASFAGKAAHGSMPQLGDNAVDKAVRAAATLPALLGGYAPHPLLGAPTASIGTLHGGGKVNIVPDRAVLEVDLRSLPGMDHADLLDRLQALWPQAVLEVLTDLPPVLTPPEHPLVRTAQDVLEALEGERPEPGTVSFFTDASILTAALGHPPVLLFGPGEPGQAHQTDEYCPVHTISEATAFYTAFARRWLEA